MANLGEAAGGGPGRDDVLLRLAVHTGLVTPAQAGAARAAAGADGETILELRRSGVLRADEVEQLAGLAGNLARRGATASLPPLPAVGADSATLAGPSSATPASTGPRASDRNPAAAEGKPRLGPYILLAELGRGGMGAVYRAHRPDLKRDYALKVILPGQDASPDAIARFRREAQAAAGLSGHPGIVGVHDIGEADGKTYFAMDLVEGKSLEALITAGNLDHRRTSELIEQAARALHFAHAHGVLHRDIKPANILVTPEGQARVADFGLAKTQDAGPESHRLTKSGAVLGTPAYMSPEQAQSETLDARADVYSLGATFYECLVGAPPFEADTIYGLLAKILKDDPKAPRRRDPRIPRDLETITLKCLEKAPERRYATAEALAADLARWRAGEPIAARPAGRLERFGKHVRRNRVPWTVGAVTGGALLAVVGFFGLRAWQQQSEAVRQVAADFQTAQALIEPAPEQALGQLAKLAERAGPDYPGLAAARIRAEARQKSLAVERLVERAGTSLETGRREAQRHDGLTAEIAGLVAQGVKATPRPGTPAAGGPEAAPDPATGGTPAPGAAADADPETDARARTLAEKTRAREESYVKAQFALGAVVELLAQHSATAAHGEARATLARLAWDRLREAEGAGQREDAARFRRDLEAWGRPEYAERLEGRGTLTLDTVPSGAEVRCFEYVDPDGDGRLEEADRGLLGTTPLRAVPLAMGSYVLVIRKAGFRDTRYPVWLERQEAEAPREPIPLLTETQIGEGYVYVPPGESILGGDEKAYSAWPREKRWIAGFCLAEREVTIAEYRAFLQALLAAGADPSADAKAKAEGTDQAVLARCPRQSTGPFWQVQNGRVVERTRLADDWPALGVSWEDAQRYCAWRTTVEGRAVSLPAEAEWERAARGADGRLFPWGEGFSWRWTVGGKSPIQAGRAAAPQRVLAAPEDVSPFGVRDLAGSVREWCQDEPRDFPGARALRGGSWGYLDAPDFRTGARSADHPTYAVPLNGFRLRAVPRTR